MRSLEPQQVEELREDLVSIRGELERLLVSTSESARPVELEQPIGRVSRIDAIAQQQMAKASRSSLEARLRLINAALVAIDEGEYGICQQCGECIAFARLKAAPGTRFCLPCQGQLEHRR